MNWKRLELGPIGTNCYIIFVKEKGLIVDPGEESELIIESLEELHVTPEAILLTHAHFDHIGAVEAMREKYNLPVYLHHAEWDWLADPTLNGSAYFPVETVTTRPADKQIEEGTFSLPPFHFEVRHTPGHSPGSVSFINHAGKLAISGDVLFKQGIGRTDLPGGNQEELFSSIEKKLYNLHDDYLVLPGHGPVTNIGEEKEHNPFLRS